MVDQGFDPALPVRGGRFAATPRDLGEFRVPLQNPDKLTAEWMFQYFHPQYAGIREIHEPWRTKVREIDPRLRVVWHPVRERWVVWFQEPTAANPFVRGWKLVLPWENPYDGSYLPPDERLLANIWARSSRKTSSRQYWDRIESEVIRDRQKKEQARQQQSRDMAGDYFDFRQIKVGYGNSNGSKFADSHSE